MGSRSQTNYVCKDNSPRKNKAQACMTSGLTIMVCIANHLDVINPQNLKKITAQKFESKKEWKMSKLHNQSLAQLPPPLHL